MALKTLQKKYDELLKVFEEVGVKLTESQKESLDTFMLDFQAKLTETRDAAIKATKKIVEERMEKQFKEVFESIKTHQKEVFEKSNKIDLLNAKINFAKSQDVLVEAMDKYLDQYVEEVLPKKSIVDYGRMQKLEEIHESLKGMLLVNDDAVEKKVASVKEELEAKMNNESKELKDKLEEYKKTIEESTKKNEELSKKYGTLVKENLIAEKTKNLPIVESQKMRERLSKMTVEDINKNYKTVLESVCEEIKADEDSKQEEKNLEEAITEIMEGDSSKKTGTDGDQGTENNADSGEEETQTTASDDEEEVGVQVTESMMQSWIETLARLTPKN